MSDSPAPVTPVPAPGPAQTMVRPNLISLAILVMAAALLLVISGRWNAWAGSRSWQTTDDAHLRRDLTPLSTKSSGIVARVAVRDYQKVKTGELLVQLRDDDFGHRSTSPPRRRA